MFFAVAAPGSSPGRVVARRRTTRKTGARRAEAAASASGLGNSKTNRRGGWVASGTPRTHTSCHATARRRLASGQAGVDTTEEGTPSVDRIVFEPHVTSAELWRKAEKARAAARHMTAFAAFSCNGAAFAQMQTNARVSALWNEAEALEDAAWLAWESEQSALLDP